MPHPLKVTHAVLALDIGGLERVVLDLIREGRRVGQQLSVLCIERPGALAPEAQTLGARILCTHKSPGLRFQRAWDIEEALKDLAPDVLHTHQVNPLFYAGAAARHARVPLVVHTEHGKHYAARFRMRWLGWLAGRYAARFFCVSADIAAEVKACRVVAPYKVCVVPNGIDTTRFTARGETGPLRQALGIPVGAPVIGTIGRLAEIKRHDLLLRAFTRLRQRLPDAHLLLVGDGSLMPDLRRLAVSLGVASCVHFTGYQSQPEQYLQLMDVFALTSRSEGMPLAILEAWAAGVPIVASRVGGVPELIADGLTGLLFPSGDEAALEEALQRLLTNRPEAQRLVEAGRDRVQSHHSLSRTAADYQNHYLELLAQKGAAA
jgi:glycosyltransferase involved in cell wall biosynthesis